MESRENKDFDLYKDIQGRTGGEIYIGVVGRCAPENQRLSNGSWICLCFLISLMKIQKNVRKMSFPSQLQEKQL